MPTSETPVVLVVEDDPPVRGLLSDVLAGEGYDVVAVHDGVTALQVIASLQVDLITLDLDLPGLSGSDLLDMLRRRKVKIPPVIVVTSTKPVRRAVHQMAQVVINKPFDIDELLQAVIELLPGRLAKAEAKLRQLVARDSEAQPPIAGAAEYVPPTPAPRQVEPADPVEQSRAGQLKRRRRRLKSRRPFPNDGAA